MDNNWNTNGQGQFSGQSSQMQNTYYQQSERQNGYQGYQNYQPYQSYQPIMEPQTDETVRISEYLVILLLCTFIPCAGIIMLFIYAFGQDVKESKKNFCRAYLIVSAINLALVLIGAILYVTFAAALF